MPPRKLRYSALLVFSLAACSGLAKVPESIDAAAESPASDTVVMAIETVAPLLPPPLGAAAVSVGAAVLAGLAAWRVARGKVQRIPTVQADGKTPPTGR